MMFVASGAARNPPSLLARWGIPAPPHRPHLSSWTSKVTVDRTAVKQPLPDKSELASLPINLSPRISLLRCNRGRFKSGPRKWQVNGTKEERCGKGAGWPQTPGMPYFCLVN